METITMILQIIIALTIINVWLIQPKRKTPYRGKGASSLQHEFTAYGLSRNTLFFIGGLKVTFALILLIGIWIPLVTTPAVAGIAFLMLGAIIMHFKVRDSFKRIYPALFMLLLCLIVLFA